VFIMIQKKTPAINPDMKTRVLQIPFTQISYPALSPDGKWVAFPAADANGNWDIYYMHYSGGDAHRITFDSSAFGQQTADISPDGSMIVYDRMNPTTGRLEVCVVSSLGGITRRVAEVGSNPRWNPDGKTIGYCLGSSTRMRSPSGYLEFWTVNIDGTQKRQVLIDSLSSKSGSYRFSFCWSPTGESIGWISTSGGKQHIVIHDVATSEKRDLTSGGENIDDLCWTNAGQIIYSSNRGGNTNLWSIPAAGGEPVQITKGSGPDIGMKASAEGNEIVYLQQQTIGHIWLARLDGSLTKQLTFDDAPIFKPSISPDGKSIAFEMDNPDPLRRSTGISIMDRDGNNRRRLSSGDEIMNNPVWSPDGRWIACSIGTGRWDSLKVGIMDASSPGVPKIVGRGIPLRWIDNSHIVSVTNTRSLLNSTGGEPPRLISADSSYYLPVLNGKYMLVLDLRNRSLGWNCAEVRGPTVTEMIAGKSSWVVPAVTGPKPLIRGFISVQGKNLFALDAQDRLVKFSLPDGRKEFIKSSFPGLRRDQFAPTFSVGADGSEIVYVDIRFNARLVMIENLLR
jgi:Tol biopolymer transport system component